ncbi:MAG: DUF1028 domain-containing protein [Phycisphaera sp.]|nr:MAG: DUF1028 domain-containing protein [Phycisphaera sp.]
MKCVLKWLIACVLAALPGSAYATWSILLADLKTGEIAVGSATCLTNFDLRAGTPVLIPGVGAATAQSFVDTTGQNRTLIRDLLASGATADDILLALDAFDPSHQTRQYGILDTRGSVATFSGAGAGSWAGGITGVLPGAGVTGGDIVYAIQGNVLTGPSVVNEAFAAIQSSTGDLPEMLMVAMEAARAQGGDGRCSCATGNPTGCGDPPPAFEKSSHIAYMLVARAGDTEGCAPTYRINRVPSDMEALTAGGAAEFIAVANSGFDVQLWPVIPDVVPARLGALRTVNLDIPVHRFELADFTGDGWDDLVSIDEMGIVVVVRPFDPVNSQFLASTASRAMIGGVDLVTGDFNGDGNVDVAVIEGDQDQLLVYHGNGDGTLADARAVSTQSGPRGLAAGDMDEDGDDEIIVAAFDSSIVDVFELNGVGDYEVAESVDVGAFSSTMVEVIRPNHDGRPDLIVAGDSNSAKHVIRKNGQPSAVGDYPTPIAPRGLEVGDFNHDGLEDAILSTGVNSVTLSGFSFVPDLLLSSTVTTQAFPTEVVATDLSGDGDSDIAYAASNWQALRLIEAGDAGLEESTGCGSGDYYLNLNVAFVDAGDPDPVLTLRDEFDSWRGSLVGITDALQSTAVLDREVLDPSPACQGNLVITLADWQGNPVTGIPVELIQVMHADGSDQVSLVGPVESIGANQYRVTLTGTGSDGSDRFSVAVTDPTSGFRTVLMPEVELIVDDLADLDDDGNRDGQDFTLWIQLYNAGDSRADQNRDGILDFRDFTAWLANYGLEC